jgi:two-component system, OmpR family, response regulator
MRVLLIEDDTVLADGLARSLKLAGHTVAWWANGEDAIGVLLVEKFNLVVLDLGLPDMDGLDILRTLRGRKATVPVLIITARSLVEDRIKGLDMGADDYLTKPFELIEFDARVRALLRRRYADGLDALICGDLSLDIAARRVFLSEKPLDLPRRELHILEAIMSRKGHLISKNQVVDFISTYNEDLNPSAVETYISRLRKKLRGSNVEIRTIRGMGYSIECH